MVHKFHRIVNLKYEIDGLHFDAAVDCDWQMHSYDFREDKSSDKVTPIEIYCFDHPEWDIKMIYQKNRNDQQPDDKPRLYDMCGHTGVDIANIMDETKEWVKGMSE